MKQLILNLCLGILCVGISCKTPTFTVTEFEGEKISFGNFGGFTGEMEAYHLLSNGQLFRQEGRSEVYHALPKIKKKAALTLFETFKKENFDTMKMEQVGNLSYFMAYETEGKQNKMVWTDENVETNPNINDFYMQLYKLTKSK